MTAASTNHFDVAVIGLGAVGSSALLALSKSGASVVGIDRFSPPHEFGSSHGETRITRQAIGEGMAYTPLALRSHHILDGVETETGASLIERCGFLYIGRDTERIGMRGKSHFLKRTATAAIEYAIEHEVLDSDELSRRFPQFVGLAGDETAYYEPGGGYVRPEACISTFLEYAQRRGARIVTNALVGSIKRVGETFEIAMPERTIGAARVIVTTGAWISGLAPKTTAAHVRVYRQALHWFEVVDPSLFKTGCTPTFIWDHGCKSTDHIYGFPPLDGRVKVATEQFVEQWHIDDLTRDVSTAEQIDISQVHVRARLAGVSDLPVQSRACLYTATPDFDFLIDCEDGIDVQVASACSGHGFKHAPAIGEALAMRALGQKTLVDLTPFAVSRFTASTNGSR